MAQTGEYRLPSAGGDGFVKLFDGTMIQWGRQTVNIPTGSTNASVVVNYPQAFADGTGAPVVVVSTSETAAGTGTLANVCIPTVIQGSGRSSFTLRVWRQASVDASVNNPDPIIGWMAFGRWM